jgi:spermidine synthase
MRRGVWLFAVVVVVVVVLWPRERVLHTVRSSFQTLVVVEDDERRCLRFGEGDRALNQSCRSLVNPTHVQLDSARAIVASTLSLEPRPRKVLLIGLGGASIPNALAALWPDVQIDAVELDPEVIHLAEQFFAFRSNERVHAFAEDGARFVREARERNAEYDLVILDACDETGMPLALFSTEFLTEVRSLLPQGKGTFIANIFATAPSAPRESAAVKGAFGEVVEVDVVRNRLLVAGRHVVPREVSPALAAVGVTLEWLSEWRVRQSQ